MGSMMILTIIMLKDAVLDKPVPTIEEDESNNKKGASNYTPDDKSKDSVVINTENSAVLKLEDLKDLHPDDTLPTIEEEQ